MALISCSNNDCDYINTTESFDDLDAFKDIPIDGVYKLSSLSTDNTFNSDELLSSSISIVFDSTNNKALNGALLFTNCPGWDNATSKNELGNYYGSWHIVTQPGGLFRHNRLLMAVFYIYNKNVSPKALVGNLEVRLLNGNPIIIVRVLRDLDLTDAKFGYTLIYPTPASKDYCNYLVFEKYSATVHDSTRTQIEEYFNSLKGE